MDKVRETGTIHAQREGDTVTFAWHGGDIAAISIKLLQDIDPRYATYAEFPTKPGARLTVGPFLLETIAYDYRRDCILVRRV